MTDNSRFKPLSPEAREIRLLETLLILAVLIAGATAISICEVDPDLWGHIRFGQDTLANGINWTTTYSFTAMGYPWVNHENLSEVLLAIGYQFTGAYGLLAAKLILGVGILFVVIRNAQQRGANLTTACAISLILAVNLSPHWTLRPQLASYVAFTVLWMILNYSFHGWEGRAQLGAASDDTISVSKSRLKYLVFIIPLMMVWTNAHGGFVAGLAVLEVYLLVRIIEAYCKREVGIGWSIWLSVIAIAAAASTLANPYGYKLLEWLYNTVLVPRPEIVEWWPPELLTWQALPLWLLLSVITISITLSKQRKDFALLVVLALVTWQALTHVRHVPFLAILVAMTLPQHLESALSRFGIAKTSHSFGGGINRPMRYLLAGTFCVAMLLLATQLAPKLRQIDVDRNQYPVDAIAYMKDQEIKGKLVVTYNWAQYALAALNKDRHDLTVPVAFDGRFRTCYPPLIIDEHFDFILGNHVAQWRNRNPNSAPPSSSAVLHQGEPELVLVSRKQPHSVQVLLENENNWVLLYQDGLAELWGRRSRYADPWSPNYISPDLRLVTNQMPEGIVAFPAIQSDEPSPGMFETLWQKLRQATASLPLMQNES